MSKKGISQSTVDALKNMVDKKQKKKKENKKGNKKENKKEKK